MQMYGGVKVVFDIFRKQTQEPMQNTNESHITKGHLAVNDLPAAELN